MNKRFIGQPDTNDDAFEAMLEESDFKEKRVSLGDEVKAKVVRIGQDYLFLDLGSRNEGLLARGDEQEDDEEVKVGTELTVYVTSMRDGAVLCARRMSAAGAAAERKTDDKSETLAQLQEAFNSGIPIEGTVKESNKGGYSVTILGQRAFCPISQIDNKFTESPEIHLEKSYTFEIIKFEESGRNIVVSRRNLLERAAEESARRIWQTLELGQTFEGTVESVRPFGAFVDIGGVQGLLHVSEISYDRIEDPAEVLESGQTIRVAIKELDPERKRISLSLKALQADPWTELDKHISVQNVYKGRVTRIAQFGAFVELMPGIDGLVHISQLGAEQRVRSPRDIVALGQEVEVKVLEIDSEARRISLTMRTDEQADENWREDLAAVKDDSRESGMGTLGDILKSKLGK